MKTYFRVVFMGSGWAIEHRNGFDFFGGGWQPVTNREGGKIRVFGLRDKASEALRELRAGRYNADTFDKGANK